MTTLIYIRHGQSESNLTNIFTGQTDVKLTELGLRQAENTARFLRDYPIDAIYASSLTRAIQTAEPTAKQHGLPIHPDDNLREIDAGKWECVPFDDLDRLYPKMHDAWVHDFGHCRPDGGESIIELDRRIISEIQKILLENAGKTIAVFCHAVPMRILAAHWQGIPIEDCGCIPWVPNASVSIAEYDDAGNYLRTVLYGYDEHQAGDATKLPNNA